MRCEKENKQRKENERKTNKVKRGGRERSKQRVEEERG